MSWNGRLVRVRHSRAVSASVGALGGLPGGVEGGPPAVHTARQRQPILRSIPIAAPGTLARRRPGATSASPQGSSARPAGRRRTGDWPRRSPFGACDGAYARAGLPGRTRAGGGAGQARGRRGQRDAGTLSRRGDRTADDSIRARVDPLRVQIAFALTRGRDARALLLTAAKRLEPLDVRRARDTTSAATLDRLLQRAQAPTLDGRPPISRAHNLSGQDS